MAGDLKADGMGLGWKHKYELKVWFLSPSPVSTWLSLLTQQNTEVYSLERPKERGSGLGEDTRQIEELSHHTENRSINWESPSWAMWPPTSSSVGLPECWKPGLHSRGKWLGKGLQGKPTDPTEWPRYWHLVGGGKLCPVKDHLPTR